MQETMVVQSGDAEGERSEARPRARHFGRCRMFKPAQIAFGGAVLDCVLLNVSAGGGRVHLSQAADVPELVTLRLRGGDTFMLRRCWRTGAHVGFEFTGSFPLDVLDGLVSAWVPGGA